MKRSTVAPVGMALLFLSLAAVPFSLTGSGPCLGSRLDSLTNAWSQIGGVFLTVYQPSSAAQLLAALEYSKEDEDRLLLVDCAAQEVVALSSADISSGADDAALSDSMQRDLAWVETEARVNEAPTRCTKVPISPAAKRARPTLATRSVAAGPINVQRIDLGEVMKLAVQSDQVTKLIHRHLADYKIHTRFELSKLASPASIPARPAIVVRRGASGCDEASAPVPDPGVELRERPRRNRVPVPAGVGVQS